MSEKIFPDTLLTTAGRQMIVDSQGGSTLTFTRVALGDGVLAQGQDQSALTAIISEKLSANISSYTDNEDGTFSLVFSVNNSTLDVGFMHREIGIMAKVDDGEEQLYAYTNAGNAATFLYDKTTPIQERVVRIDFVVGSAENLSVEIDGSVVYPTRGEVQQMINAHDSSAASHAVVFAGYTKTNNAPMFNKRDIITTSGTYTAPVTGWYKITVKGGGGGGGGGNYLGSDLCAPGGGGGEGGTTITYERMTAGDTAIVTVGAGGTGGANNGSGADGGDSSVVVGGNTYTAAGGKLGANRAAGAGGAGTIPGEPGGAAPSAYRFGNMGGSGGGAGGGVGVFGQGSAGVNGGGGAGGQASSTSGADMRGGAGGNGYVWFEYFDSSLNP